MPPWLAAAMLEAFEAKREKIAGRYRDLVREELGAAFAQYEFERHEPLDRTRTHAFSMQRARL